MKKKLKKRLDTFLEMISTNEFKILPGNLAYSFFLAVIPIVSIIFYLLMSFNLPMTLLSDFIADVFPKNVASVIQPVFTNEIPANQFITLCLSVVVITSGCNSIIIASNTIFEFENASFIKRIVKSLFLTLLLVILILKLLLL